MQSMHSWFVADHRTATLEAAGILIFCMLCRQMMATTMHTIYLRYHAQVGSGRVGRVGSCRSSRGQHVAITSCRLSNRVGNSCNSCWHRLPSHVATRPHPTDPDPTRPETTCPNPIRPNTDPTDRGPTQPDHNSTRRRPDPTPIEPTPTG